MLVAATLLGLWVIPAMADDRARAGELFKQGNELRIAGKYAEALEKYKAAFNLVQSFKIAFNVALTQEKLGNYPAAYKSYRHFFKTGTGQSPDKMLLLAQEKLEKLAKKISLLKVTSPLAGATVWVNSAKIGKTPLSEPAVLKPGYCQILIKSGGYKPWVSNMHLEAGQETVVEAVLEPLLMPGLVQNTKPGPQTKKPVPKSSPQSPQRDLEEPPTAAIDSSIESDAKYRKNQKRRYKTIWAWSSLGAGLACALGSAVLYGVGSSKVNSAYDEYSQLGAWDSPYTFEEKWADVEAGSKLYIGGHVLAGISVATLGVSIYMFLTRPAIRERDLAKRRWHLMVSTDGQNAEFAISRGF